MNRLYHGPVKIEDEEDKYEVRRGRVMFHAARKDERKYEERGEERKIQL